MRKGEQMKKLLVTGGSVFVSKYTATWFAKKGYDVYVLNRGNHEQPEHTTLIKADRYNLKDTLKDYHFDAVLDITAYNAKDVEVLLEGLGSFDDYILISSSAVYPETTPQPFSEESEVGSNAIWGSYGTDKIAAEQYIQEKVPHAYILRPPYLYGPMQNLYREAFVFQCAMQHRPFYIPKDGTMPLQFFHVEDLCKFMETLLNIHPQQHIFNVGNKEIVDINRFVELCYQVVGEDLHKVYVDHPKQRDYFSFHDYGYVLDVEKQKELYPEEKDLFTGLQESYAWYLKHPEDVQERNYISFIDENFTK